jgi:ubiquinone/menaquinone biosynthesis C-methylase UbiE
MSIEQEIARSYAHARLEQELFAALQAAGKDLACLTPADLAPVDEFHIGGRAATVDFSAQLALSPGQHLLDIGCGLGGASRYFAEAHDCRVTGLDLTEDYVRTATMLAKLVGLSDKTTYLQGSALALPFTPAQFDAATMLHVGMNIADKAALFAQIRRVLKPGAVFGIYDVMREGGAGDFKFPVPWASSPEMSFLDTAATYEELLKAAGFAITARRSRRDFGIEFFQKMQARMAQSKTPPALGLHLILGPSAGQKFANLLDNLQNDRAAPVELICRAI